MIDYREVEVKEGMYKSGEKWLPLSLLWHKGWKQVYDMGDRLYVKRNRLPKAERAQYGGGYIGD